MLDGGFEAWTRAGLPVTRDAAAPAERPTGPAAAGSHLATWHDVQDARSGAPDAVIVDTRSDGEHLRHDGARRARRRHPRRGPYRVDAQPGPDGDFKPAAELRAMYEAAGVTPDREVVTYCQGGYRAAHTYLALRLLGYPRVRNYVGSWKEWGDRADLPIEIVPEPSTAHALISPES